MRDAVAGAAWALAFIAVLAGLYGLAWRAGEGEERRMQRMREENCASFGRGTPGFADCLTWTEPD